MKLTVQKDYVHTRLVGHPMCAKQEVSESMYPAQQMED